MSINSLDPTQSALAAWNLPSKSAVAEAGAFQKYMVQAKAMQAPSAELPVSTGTNMGASAFDPFAVVRSGAVSESNSFVQALEHMYGIVEGSLTHPELAAQTAAASHAAPPDAGNELSNSGAASARLQAAATVAGPVPFTPAMAQTRQTPAADLPQAITEAVQQSVAGLQSQTVLDTVLNKLD